MNQQAQRCQCANCPGAACQCGCQDPTPAAAPRQACACGPACQCGPGCQCDAAEAGCVCNA
ncbi:hypothetical protein H8N03_24975 [Ramlibacter sp. USB13]|uniref:Uncharacterized protein n=1 Tax=Ramlibacter cellulosilyticus TaxID=2764187 RepID=A0A923MY10_9BURK|nr:hypothetical protein [Ramlibacter cellulosilyticus]MBC5786214.1 hypothetical protein [Ramlibacter cellulosilyticus]